MLLVFYVCLYSAVRSEHPCGNSAILTFKLASACDSLNSAEVIDRRGGICSSLLSWLLSWQTAMQWHIPPKYDGRQKLPAGRRVLTMQQIVASCTQAAKHQSDQWISPHMVQFGNETKGQSIRERRSTPYHHCIFWAVSILIFKGVHWFFLPFWLYLTSQSYHNQINLFYAFAANFSFQGEENDKGRRRLVISNKLKCWNGLLILMQSRPIQSSQVFWGAAKQSSVLLLLMLMLLLLLLQCFATWPDCRPRYISLCSAVQTWDGLHQQLKENFSGRSPNLPLTGHVHHLTHPPTLVSPDLRHKYHPTHPPGQPYVVLDPKKSFSLQKVTIYPQ